MRRLLQLLAIGCLLISSAGAENLTGKIVVDLRDPGPKFPRTLHGVFFEDINYGADGGLYAELVQNRSFEHEENRYSWSKIGNRDQVRLYIKNDLPLNENNLHYLSVDVLADGLGVGVENAGYDRISVKQGEKLTASLFVRSEVDLTKVKIALLGSEDKILCEAELTAEGTEWQKLTATLDPLESDENARIAVLFNRKGIYDIDMVSLFPHETFGDHANGLRSDIAQLLADMKPGFIRFPGGCIVEGRELSNAYRWKDTIGEVQERKQNWNLWADRHSPQYHQTYGLGFFEFFQLCDDIGAEPVPIVNCGMACQARRGTHAALEELQPWIQDALDLIEFANGPIGTSWGAKRASMGHPEPFNMKYLGIGNEQWNEEYFERYTIFHKAFRDKYPDIELISTSGPQPSGDLWDFAWKKFRSGTPADLVDEHYYRSPEWFLANHERYDSYERNGPKVFAGEFAAHAPGRRNNLRAALAEAAFMTGLWRNSDVVDMACYAPLFARIGHTQWVPDLIWFDHAKVFGSPSYYVQKMYANNLPTLMLKTAVEAPLMKPKQLVGPIGLGTWRTQAEFKDIKVTSGDKILFEFNPADELKGWRQVGGNWSVHDGVIRQSADGEIPRIFKGELDWSDYTISLKAKKTGGAEGFLISFAAADPASPTLFNIGGWNNTEHAIEIRGSVENRVRGKIETGRWYDIRIELKGATVKCFLDGEMILQTTAQSYPALYAASGFNPEQNQVVLAVANPSNQAVTAEIEPKGGKFLTEDATAEVLTADSDTAENSLDQPQDVFPRQTSIAVSTENWLQEFPPYSFTILKVKAE